MNSRVQAALRDTTSGMTLFCPVTSNINNQARTADLQANNIPYVWSAYQGTLAAGIHETWYQPWNMAISDHGGRPPTRIGNAAYGAELDWMLANHPDWIMYAQNAIRPGDPPVIAYAYSQAYIPLDISNAACRDYLWSNTMWDLPVIANSPYSSCILTQLQAGLAGLAFDSLHAQNIVPANSWDTAGATMRRVGHYASDGTTWVPKYSVSLPYDAAYIADMHAYFDDMAARVHAYSATGTLSGNLFADTGNIAESNTLLSKLDILLDEQSATGFGIARLSGAAWSTWAAFTQLAAKNGGLAVDSYAAASSDTTIARDDLIWSLANFLLVRSTQSYFSLASVNTATGKPSSGSVASMQHAEWTTVKAIGIPLEDFWPHNGCYVRLYSGGLIVVNPSLLSVSYPLTRTYTDLYGKTYTGSLVLPATSAAILLTGEAIRSYEYNARDGSRLRVR